MQKISAFCLLSLLCLTSAQILSIVPSSLNFGDLQAGQSEEKIVYVINIGEDAVALSGAGGDLDAPFNVQQNCQNNTLSPGESCKMIFSFTSNDNGIFTAVSVGTWNDFQFIIDVVANVLPPHLSISPTLLDFGTVQVGDSVQKTVYISNISEAPVTMEGYGGGVDAPYSINQNCEGTTLNPGDSCEIIFSFTPASVGNALATSSGNWNNQEFDIQLLGSAQRIPKIFL